jgi:preprotein translocase subunit SecA
VEQEALLYRGRAKTELLNEFSRWKTVAKNGATPDEIECGVFALVGEIASASDVLNMNPYRTQYLAALALRRGKLIQMDTGEGKTLVATLPAVVEYLCGRRVIIVTANEFLASRDAAWMRPLFNTLGISVAAVARGQSPSEKQRAYWADIIYTSADQLIFDSLRNYQVRHAKAQLDIPKAVAIVDEVDAVLIDQANQPFSLSKSLIADLRPLYRVWQLSEQLIPDDDYTMSHDRGTVELTETGLERVFELVPWFGLLCIPRPDLLFFVYCCLWAKTQLECGRDYFVENHEIVLIDNNTGRPRHGSRYGYGYQQAIEVKENLPLTYPGETIAKMTVYSFFREFTKICGMSGSAFHEAFEFKSLYGLDVVPIPPNRPRQRLDLNDLIFSTKEAKLKAVVLSIQEIQEKHRPVLVGTISVDDAEAVSHSLASQGLANALLTATNHKEEAEIIKQAGQAGRVTIAARMAGRGVDIRLSEDSALAGGLHVIGFERQDTRRLDEQLQGRAGRQGDLGSSQFFLSLEDHLFEAMGVQKLMERLGLVGDEFVDSRLLTRRMRAFQRKQRDLGFSARKSSILVDSLLDPYRREFYHRRDYFLNYPDISSEVTKSISSRIKKAVKQIDGGKSSWEALWVRLSDHYEIDVPPALRTSQSLAKSRMAEELAKLVTAELERRWSSVQEQMRGNTEVSPQDDGRLEQRDVFLAALDFGWAVFLSDAESILEDSRFRTYSRPDLFVPLAGSRLVQAYGDMRHMVEDRVFHDLITIHQYETRDRLFHWEGTTTDPPHQEESAHARFEGALPESESGSPQTPESVDIPPRITMVQAAITDYLAHLESTGKSKEQKDEIIAVLGKFAAFGTAVDLVNLKLLTEQLKVFVKMIAQEGLTRRQRHRQMRIVFGFFLFLVNGRQLSTMPQTNFLGLVGSVIALPLLATWNLFGGLFGSLAIFLVYFTLARARLPFVELRGTLDPGPTLSQFWHYLDTLFFCGSLSRVGCLAIGLFPLFLARTVFGIFRRLPAQISLTVAAPFQISSAASFLWLLMLAHVIPRSIPWWKIGILWLLLSLGGWTAHLLLYSLGRFCLISGLELLLFGNTTLLAWHMIPALVASFGHKISGPIVILSVLALLALYIVFSHMGLVIDRVGHFDFLTGRIQSRSSTIWLETYMGYTPHVVAYLAFLLLAARAEDSIRKIGALPFVIAYCLLLACFLTLWVRKRYRVADILAFLRQFQATVRKSQPGIATAEYVRRKVVAAWLLEVVVQSTLIALVYLAVVTYVAAPPSRAFWAMQCPLISFLLVVLITCAYKTYREVWVRLYPASFRISGLSFNEYRIDPEDETEPWLKRIARRITTRFKTPFYIVVTAATTLIWSHHLWDAMIWISDSIRHLASRLHP